MDKIAKGIELKGHNTFRIGGSADYFVSISSTDELKEAINFAKENKLPFKVLGGGSNLLISDDGFRGLIIKNEIKGIEWEEDENSVLVISGAGENWDYLVGETVNKGLFGLENLSLIPGTVGAAPIQNIGAYGSEVKRVIDWVEVLDTEDNSIRKISNKECHFGYRNSIFKQKENEDLIVTKVAFKLGKTGDTFIGYRDLADYFMSRGVARATPKEVREAVIEIREKKLPDTRKVGTAGSFFKNPVVTSEKFDELKKEFPELSGHAEDGAMKISAAWVIDNLLSLKGFCIGDACVHDRQALVIVNKGNASAKDINELANLIQKKFKEKTGIELEREVREI